MYVNDIFILSDFPVLPTPQMTKRACSPLECQSSCFSYGIATLLFCYMAAKNININNIMYIYIYIINSEFFRTIIHGKWIKEKSDVLSFLSFRFVFVFVVEVNQEDDQKLI